MAKSAVATKHPDYIKNLKAWGMMDDVCEGEVRIKERGELYLPRPAIFGDKHNPKSSFRYREYLRRAVFYGVTGQTLTSHVGMAFGKLPDFKRPDDFEYMIKNADGAGRSIYQLSQLMTEHVLKHYRCAIYVDYPSGVKARNLAEQKALGLKPTINVLDAYKVINWDTQIVNNTEILSLVVIEESASVISDDGFSRKTKTQYRVLRLINGLYSVQLFRPRDDGEFDIDEPIFPTDFNGNPWKFIPFTFCGAVDNTPSIRKSPMIELALLNLAHYRNSADVEESAFTIGQPIFSMPDLTEAKVKEMRKQGELEIGSSRAVPHKIEIVQASENNLSRSVMGEKWNQMKEMGARLIESGGATKTATEADSDSAIQHSVLSLVVSNVSEALQMALQWCVKYTHSNESAYSLDDLNYVISQDFNRIGFSQEKAKRLYDASLANILPREVWYSYEQSGVMPEMTWKEAEEKLEEQMSGLPSGYGGE